MARGEPGVRDGAAPGAFIPAASPKPRRLGPARAGGQHCHRGVVGEDRLATATLAAATLERPIRADAAAKGAPEWVHLLPIGFMQSRGGRTYDPTDPGGLILAFQANGIDLPIDCEHQSDNPEAKVKGPIRAAGWIKAL